MDRADLSEYDLAASRLVMFEVQSKAIQLNMSMPGPLLDVGKPRAKAEGIKSAQ